MNKILFFVLLLNSSIVFSEYDWKDKPDSFFYRVGKYVNPKDRFLWMDNKKKLVQISFHSDIYLKSRPVAELNSEGFYIDGKLKCKMFDNYNVKFGEGNEEAWFINNDLKKSELEKLKKQFKKYRICDVPPLYNVIDKKETYRYIAPAKLVDGQKSVFKTMINGKEAFFKYKNGRILYSLEWRRKRHKECMERIIKKSTQDLISKTLKCLEDTKDYYKCNVTGYSRNQCTMEELFGYPKGEMFEPDQDPKDMKKIKKAIDYTVSDALKVKNGEDYEIVKCELMKNGDAQIRFYHKDKKDDLWFTWTHKEKPESVHLHFSACPED